jgi:hypothetical protein
VLVVATSGLTIRYFHHPAWQESASVRSGRSTLPDSRARDAQLTKAIDYALAHGDTALYSDYWTAMPMQYLGHGRLTVSALPWDRFPEDVRQVHSAARIAYVIDTLNPDTAPIMTALNRHHVSYQLHRMGSRIAVVDDLGPGGQPAKLGLGQG